MIEQLVRNIRFYHIVLRDVHLHLQILLIVLNSPTIGESRLGYLLVANVCLEEGHNLLMIDVFIDTS